MNSALLIPKKFQPVEVSLPFVDTGSIAMVEQELKARASKDKDKCFGYFPALHGAAGIDTSLPLSKDFSEANPIIEVRGRYLNFNFLRLSLVQQQCIAAFHIDTDAATAVTGDVETITQRNVWRLLLNLSSDTPRHFVYADIDPESVEMTSSEGYLYYDNYIDPRNIKPVTLPPRNNTTVSGVLFCSSRVLHSGQDDARGHFVAGYGCEDIG